MMVTEQFIPTDGVTDSSAAIQAALDTGGTVKLPPGQVVVSKPLRITKAGTKLIGQGTVIRPNFGSGYQILAQPPRPFPTTIGPSLVPGPGGAVRQPKLLLHTEPGLAKLGTGQSLCVSGFFRRESPANDAAAVFVHCGSNYGANLRRPWGLWDRLGRLMVMWNGVENLADPSVGANVGTIYFFALTYDGSRVRLLVGQPGQPLDAAVDFAFTGNVPMYSNGLDVVSVGFDAVGPVESLSNGPADVTLDGLEFANVVRYHVGDTAPAVKPAPITGSALVMNWETEGPWFVGRRENFNPPARNAYFLPYGSQETQAADFTVRGITLSGDFDASGVCMYDTIASTADTLQFNGTYHGFTLRGSTYAGRFRDMGGVCGPFFWLQTGQSEGTTASGLSPSAAGIPFVTWGAVGGSYSGLLVSPLSGSIASVYCNGSNEVNVYGGQIDDEGQTVTTVAPVIADAAEIKLNGVQLVRTTVGPLARCCAGGTVHLFGSWLVSQPGTAELLHFVDPPVTPAAIFGCRVPPGAAFTLFSGAVNTVI